MFGSSIGGCRAGLLVLRRAIIVLVPGGETAVPVSCHSEHGPRNAAVWALSEDASGRNPDRSWRNEEHGLYENTSSLADEVIRQWQAPEDCAFGCVEDIVAPHDVAMFAEPLSRDGAITHRFHTLHMPRTPGRPGQTGEGAADPLPLLGLAPALDVLKTLPDNLRDIAHDGTHPCHSASVAG